MGWLQRIDSAAPATPPSLKHRIRSANCFSCFFRGCSGDVSASGGAHHASQVSRCPSTWLRSKAQDLAELKERCHGLIVRPGRPRRHSADFVYDPLSYALNFDEGTDLEGEGEMISPAESRFRNFSSRLPPTPPHP